MLHQDYETYHFRELKDLGSWSYADEDLGVWCVCYYDDETGSAGVWKPGDPVPEPFQNPFQTHCAWNANFERDVYERVLVPRYGFPSTEIEQWRDPSAVARYRGYPTSLKLAAEALAGEDGQKDEEGRKLMLKMAKPRKHEPGQVPIWWNEPENVHRLIDYCKQDVLAECEIHKQLGDLPKSEQEIFWLDRKINERGVKVDVEAVDLLLEVIKKQEYRANTRVRQITDEMVTKVSNVKDTLRWLETQDVFLDDLSKKTVEQTLPHSTGKVREVLQIRQDNAKTSTAKVKAFKNAVAEDGRIHGMFQYHGAHTGRWTGRLVQLQNLPQGSNLNSDQIEELHKQLRNLSAGKWLDHVNKEYGAPMPVISSMIRSLIVAEGGYDLWVYDYKSIEPRVLSWIAGEEKLLTAYHQGQDAYIQLAAKIYNKPEKEVTKKERQFGKMAILGAGYGMGFQKFYQSCLNAGLEVEEAEAMEVIQIYRNYYERIPAFWRESEEAMRTAYHNPDKMIRFGRNNSLIAFRRSKGVQDLQLMLPSGRVLFFPKPHIDGSREGWLPQLAYKSYGMGKSFSKALYGGLIVENIVQAIARDLMCYAMLAMDRAGFRITMTVHDEIVCEEPEEYSKNTAEFEKLMCTTPDWAEGIPVEVEGYQSRRYRK